MRGDFGMKYLWEALLAAKEEGFSWEKVRFCHDPGSSAYLEMAVPCLNETSIQGEAEVAVNTYYRFYSIFHDLFGPEQREYGQLRTGLTNLLLHMLAENDARQGMTREEYYKKLLLGDFCGEAFGGEIRELFLELDREGRELVLSGWLRSCRTGSALAIFLDMVQGMVRDSIVYHNQEHPDELLIYTRQKKSKELVRRMELIIKLFLDIRYQAEIFYEYHFGIIGMEETMQIGEIAIYSGQAERL